MKISLLSPEVVAGISAGEVIERPASIVKELVENSLDAGATAVRVEIDGGGMKRIRVTDNGTGVAPGEALLAFSRHATSKLRSLSDLGRIGSYGFRGEALAAIAAAGDVEMLSRVHSAREGVRVTGVAGDSLKAQPAGCSEGTAVTVTDLFRKTPARLKFIKSPGSETSAVGRAVEPYALTRCDVHFVLVVDGSERMNAPATKDQLERIRVVLGSAAEGLVPFAGGAGPIEVSGFAERPGSVRKRGRHWLMVNSRPVDDRSLRHALLAGYRGQIPREMFPTAVIFLRVPPERLDVNVHPAKSEVRFADQQAIYNSLTAAIGSAFGSGSLRDSAAKLDADLEAPAQTALPIKDGVTLPPSSGYFAVPPMEAEPAVRIGDIQILGQLFETYIIARDVQGLLIADQHAAHEKIIYQRLMNLRGGGIRQNLLVPATLELAASEASLLQKCRPALENLGFEMEEFGGRSFVIRSAPADTQDRDIPDLIRQVLSEVEESGRVPAEFDLARRVCASMACHLAVKAGKRLASREMEALVRELLALSDPLCCPHGRPTLMRLDASQLSRTFRRPPG